MDWENERYVRVYTRDTIDWVALGWEAQSLFLLLIRKVDRSGVLEVGKHGARGVAGLIGMPVDVVERALAVLTADGCVTICDGCLLMPNFIEAQEAKQSDKQRQKECRDKRRADAKSRNVTRQSRNVTEGHGQSHAVTDGHTLSPQPSLASQSNQPGDPPARDPGTTGTEPATAPHRGEPGKPTTSQVLSMFSAIRARTCATSALFYQPSSGATEKCAALLAGMDRSSVADIEPVITLACEHVRDGAEDWTDGRNKDPNFLWGAIAARWTALREELHGCAPKQARRQQDQGQPVRANWGKPVTMADVEAARKKQANGNG